MTGSVSQALKTSKSAAPQALRPHLFFGVNFVSAIILLIRGTVRGQSLTKNGFEGFGDEITPWRQISRT